MLNKKINRTFVGMWLHYRTVFLLMLTLWSHTGLSQKAKGNNGGKPSYTEKPTNKSFRMKSEKGKLNCPLMETNGFPFHSLGLKMGDPIALTYKYYFNEQWGFVVDGGSAASALYNRYYRDQFVPYYQGDSLTTSRASLSYLTHKVIRDWVGELKIMHHISAKSVSPGLRLYIGAGIETKSTKLRYDYIYLTGILNSNYGKFLRNRFTYGAQVTTGIEFASPHAPISAFMEVELYRDLLLDPGWMRIEGGAGLRYVIKPKPFYTKLSMRYSSSPLWSKWK